MARLPLKPVSGQPIPKGWFTDLWNYIKDLTPVRGDGKTIIVKNGVISAVKGKGGGSGGVSSGGVVYWAKITGVGNSNLYEADIYKQRGGDAIEQNKHIYVYDIVDNLPIDTWVPVIKQHVDEETYGDINYVCIQQMGDV